MATISRRGGTWQAKVRRKGYPTQSATFQTKAAAERWARDIESKVDRGTLSPVESDARRITLREAIERYEVEVTATKRGANRERARLARWKAHELADRVLASIRPHDMAQARNAMAARGLGPNSIRLELAPLSHLFTVARKEWGLEGLPNPVREITKPSTVGTERDRRLQGDEEARILAAAAGLVWWLRPAIILAIETAMRRGELAALRWEWIDLKRGILRLPLTKNGDARTVPLSAVAIETLEALPRNLNGRVLGTNPDEISHQFAAARAAAGIADLVFHDLRHEATSRLFERGDLNVVEVAAITGHKTLQMLKRYSHPRAEDLARKLRDSKPRSA
jgi:integrase